MQCRAAGESIGEIPKVTLFRRWVVFNLVGGLGILVQLSVLELLAGILECNYLGATAAAVEAAVLHNFFWHERCTWADRAGGGWAAMLGRLIRFHLSNGLFSLLGNVLLMRLFVGIFAIGYLPANVLAIAVCSVLNFFAGDRLVFPAAATIHANKN